MKLSKHNLKLITGYLVTISISYYIGYNVFNYYRVPKDNMVKIDTEIESLNKDFDAINKEFRDSSIKYYNTLEK